MKYVIYGHGGSGNHGCEAIIRTTIKMIPAGQTIDVYSEDVKRDKKYGAVASANFHQNRIRKDSPVFYMLCRGLFKVTRNPYMINYFSLSEVFKNKGAVCLSVGGDNYCNGEPERHAARNKKLSKHNKTVLWGCSVTPELMKNPKYVEDMKKYDLITARESITYNALVGAGVTNVKLVSDPAFSLEISEVVLPDIYNRADTIGLNMSPLVIKYGKNSNILMKNVEILINYIFEETDFNIALIPHVLIEGNNDLVPLRLLYEKYKESKRICLIDNNDDLNCCQIKYVISRCRFMIATRTHASIAAYSTSVPTLVLGYSVKSKGIATDLFGTDSHYVLPVDSIERENEILDEFKWIMNHEEDIRNIYAKIMPEYKENALKAGQYLCQLS